MKLLTEFICVIGLMVFLNLCPQHANAANAVSDKSACLSYLNQVKGYSWVQMNRICEQATEHTPWVLYQSLSLGFNSITSLSLIAGEASAYTYPCINWVRHNFRKTYSYTYAMICRGISRDRYFALVNPANQTWLRGRYSYEIARAVSMRSFVLFTRAYRELNGKEYCEDFACD